MYGIINKSIEELVIHNYGIEKWEAVKKRSGIDVDFFVSNESYEDSITYTLAQSISHECNISIQQTMETFGEWWILKTGKEKYGALIEAGGANLKMFLVGLPNFHNRIMLMYPKLTPPEFQISNIQEKSLYVHYISKRTGLNDFVKGLLVGLGKLYKTPVTITTVDENHSGSSYNETYYLSWN